MHAGDIVPRITIYHVALVLHLIKSFGGYVRRCVYGYNVDDAAADRMDGCYHNYSCVFIIEKASIEET